MDLTKTGMTADDLRAVARKELTIWQQRQATWLTGEIARLKGTPRTPEDEADLADDEKQLAGLPAYVEQQLSEIDPAHISVGAGLSYLGVLIREKAYRDLHLTPEQQADWNGFGRVDVPQRIAAYKPRPLGGVWATAPFLHNGSVPTIFDLLSPVEERPKEFRVGSREYDAEKLGLKEPASGYWLYDTKKDGNHNTGHEFSREYKERKKDAPPSGGIIGPFLEKPDRLAIIEHLKVRNDDVDGPQKPHLPKQAKCDPPKRLDVKKRYVR